MASSESSSGSTQHKPDSDFVPAAKTAAAEQRGRQQAPAAERKRRQDSGGAPGAKRTKKSPTRKEKAPGRGSPVQARATRGSSQRRHAASVAVGSEPPATAKGVVDAMVRRQPRSGRRLPRHRRGVRWPAAPALSVGPGRRRRDPAVGGPARLWQDVQHRDGARSAARRPVRGHHLDAGRGADECGERRGAPARRDAGHGDVRGQVEHGPPRARPRRPRPRDRRLGV
jgi:hypothetical protein